MRVLFKTPTTEKYLQYNTIYLFEMKTRPILLQITTMTGPRLLPNSLKTSITSLFFFLKLFHNCMMQIFADHPPTQCPNLFQNMVSTCSHIGGLTIWQQDNVALGTQPNEGPPIRCPSRPSLT